VLVLVERAAGMAHAIPVDFLVRLEVELRAQLREERVTPLPWVLEARAVQVAHREIHHPAPPRAPPALSPRAPARRRAARAGARGAGRGARGAADLQWHHHLPGWKGKLWGSIQSSAGIELMPSHSCTPSSVSQNLAHDGDCVAPPAARIHASPARAAGSAAGTPRSRSET